MPPQETIPVQSVTQVQPVVKLGKFKASRMIVSESWNVLKQDKEMMIFPILSSIATLLVLLAFLGGFFFLVLSGSWSGAEEYTREEEIMGYAIGFAYYLITFFILNFFQAGMMLIANARFNGQNMSFGDGIRGAVRNSFKIFQFALISSTVGLILQIISNKSKIVGKIVAAIFGAAWQILTYFSLPSLIIGEKGVKESFKDSASVIRKTWGESIIVNFGAGLIFMILFLVGFLVALGVVVAAFSLSIQSTFVFVLIGVFLFLYIVILTIVSSTLSLIFKLALYKFATTGTIPSGFSPELIQQAVKGGN